MGINSDMLSGGDRKRLVNGRLKKGKVQRPSAAKIALYSIELKSSDGFVCDSSLLKNSTPS